MNFLIKNYINNLTKDQVDSFAKQNNVFLNPEELDFTYNFVKKNHSEVLSDFTNFDFSKYQKYYSQENYNKIKNLLYLYYQKYHQFL